MMSKSNYCFSAILTMCLTSNRTSRTKSVSTTFYVVQRDANQKCFFFVLLVQIDMSSETESDDFIRENIYRLLHMEITIPLPV